LPVQVAFVGISIANTHKIAKIRSDFSKEMKRGQKIDKEDAAILAKRVFTNLQKNPEAFLYKQSPKIQNVAEHALEVLEGEDIKKKEAVIKESKKLMDVMKERITKKLSLEIFGTILKIVIVAITIFALFSPIGPGLLLLIIIAGSIGLGFTLYSRSLRADVLPIQIDLT